MRLPSRPFIWGFVDQAVSSGTNFALAIGAGRLLGPGGLGTIFLAFSIYLIVLGFQRSLLTDPLSVSRSEGTAAQLDDFRACVTLSIAAGAVGTVAMLAVGLLLPGPLGRAAFLIAPWLIPVLLQDAWRVMLFRAGRASSAAVNDLVWAVVMAAFLPLVIHRPSDVAVTAWFAGGCAVAAVFGFVQLRTKPAALGTAARWWNVGNRRLGSMLAVENLIWNSGHYGVLAALAYILTVADLGGLRACQSIFAPLSLVIPALSLPGMPAMTAHIKRNRSDAIRLARRIAIAALVVTSAYVIPFWIAGRYVLDTVFGSEFARFRDLVAPVGVAQILVAGIAGPSIFLKADRRGSALVVARAAGFAVSAAATISLGVMYGVVGAAWGFALGTCASAIAMVVLFQRSIHDGRAGASPILDGEVVI